MCKKNIFNCIVPRHLIIFNSYKRIIHTGNKFISICYILIFYKFYNSQYTLMKDSFVLKKNG